MFTKDERRDILAYYNEFYNTYFNINYKSSNFWFFTRVFKNKYINKNKQLNFKQIKSRIYESYSKMKIECLKRNKMELKSRINSLFNRDFSNYFSLIITIFFTFSITFSTLYYTWNSQDSERNFNIISDNNNKIQENIYKENEIKYKIESSTNKQEKDFLEQEIKKIDNDNANFIRQNSEANKNYNEESKEAIKTFAGLKVDGIPFISIALIIIVLLSGFSAFENHNFYYSKKSFLLLCLNILDEVEEEKLKQNNIINRSNKLKK